MASSGVASLLLPGGRTAHSRFKIPFNLHKDSTCPISHGSELALLLQNTNLIIWDEAPMMNQYAFEAVDRTLRDIMKAVDPNLEGKPFGGKVVVFGGDFWQILPVIVKGRREDIVGLCLCRSTLWNHVNVMKLNINMRLLNTTYNSNTAEQAEFAKWLLEVGEGRVPTITAESDIIRLPEDIILPSQDLNDLIQFVYSDLSIHSVNPKYFVECGILTPTNEQVNAINTIVMAQFPGEEVEYLSADTVEGADD